MAKNKKKNKAKADKPKGVAGKASKTFQAIADNPLVADVVAAALVATASALKDSKKAQRMAASVGEELEGLAKDGARRGNAMWKLALDIGRKALDEIGADLKSGKSSKKAAAKPRKKAMKAPAGPKKGRSAATRTR